MYAACSKEHENSYACLPSTVYLTLYMCSNAIGFHALCVGVVWGSLCNSRHPVHCAWGREAPSSRPERRFRGKGGIRGIRGWVPKSLFWSNHPSLLAIRPPQDKGSKCDFEQPSITFGTLGLILNNPPSILKGHPRGARGSPKATPRDSKVPLGRSWEPLGKSWVPLEDPGGAEYAVKSSLSGTKGA